MHSRKRKLNVTEKSVLPKSTCAFNAIVIFIINDANIGIYVKVLIPELCIHEELELL